MKTGLHPATWLSEPQCTTSFFIMASRIMIQMFLGYIHVISNGNIWLFHSPVHDVDPFCSILEQYALCQMNISPCRVSQILSGKSALVLRIVDKRQQFKALIWQTCCELSVDTIGRLMSKRSWCCRASLRA